MGLSAALVVLGWVMLLTIASCMAVMAIPLVAFIVFRSVSWMASLYKETRNRRARWKAVQNGFCPDCERKTERILSQLVCGECGIIAPDFIYSVKGKCSFCGMWLGTTTKKDIVGKAGDDGSIGDWRIISWQEPFCAHCVRGVPYRTTMSVRNGCCNVCGGSVESVFEERGHVAYENVVEIFHLCWQCTYCGRRDKGRKTLVGTKAREVDGCYNSDYRP